MCVNGLVIEHARDARGTAGARQHLREGVLRRGMVTARIGAVQPVLHQPSRRAVLRHTPHLAVQCCWTDHVLASTLGLFGALEQGTPFTSYLISIERHTGDVKHMMLF